MVIHKLLNPVLRQYETKNKQTNQTNNNDTFTRRVK